MKIKFTIIALTIVLPLGIFAQCKNQAKKLCMPKLMPYTHNGQLNSSTLLAGQTAELELTFNAGLEYRILVCASEVLGKASFKLIDVEKNTVFNSSDINNSEFWDFNVESTQQFTLEVTIPKSESSNDIVPSGCVSVLVGFKQ